MKAINWNDADQGVTFEYEDIPADMVELANEWHQNLIESAAEASEELMEKYLGGEELTEAEIKGALRQRSEQRNHPGNLWFCVQEQRCSGDAGCGN